MTAIVLNFRTPHYAVKCVKTLRAQSIAKNMEIFVMDNHSDDESIGILRAHLRDMKDVRIIESAENIGFGRGNNMAAALAKGKYLLILNPDNALPADTVERLVDMCEKDPKIGIVAPALIHPDETVRPSARPFPRIRDLFLKRMSSANWYKQYEKDAQKAGDSARDVDWIVGACFLIPRELFEALGGFDPRFFLFFEDTDLCRRCLKAGKRVVYAPSIRVADRKERLSDGGFFSIFTKKTTRIHVISAIKYFWKWRGGDLTVPLVSP